MRSLLSTHIFTRESRCGIKVLQSLKYHVAHHELSLIILSSSRRPSEPVDLKKVTKEPQVRYGIWISDQIGRPDHAVREISNDRISEGQIAR